VAKKVLTWLAVAFVLFYLFTQPTQAANAVKSLGHGIALAGHQLLIFLSSLSK
jgi:hypothetical protein